MSDSLSDADKIRNKRLAKLGSNTTESASNENSPSGQSDTTQSQPQNPPKINIRPAAAAQPSNPFSQLGLKSSGDSQPKQPIPKPTAKTTQPESLQEWEDKTLSEVFRFTVQNDKPKDHHGNTLYKLEGLRSELEESGEATRLSNDNLQQAIIECATAQGQAKQLDYLLPCWKRLTRHIRNSKASRDSEDKQAVFKEARRLCMSSAIFAITVPDLFGQDANSPNPLVKQMLHDPNSDRGIDRDFIDEAVSRFEEEDEIREALVSAAEQLSAGLSKQSMVSNYRPYITAFQNLVQNQTLVNELSKCGRFLPARLPAQSIETQTLLGPLFRLSPMQAEPASTYFSSPKTRDVSSVRNAQSALRMTLQTHHGELFQIVDRFVKASKDCRERLLDWFAHCVNTNHKRRAMRPDSRVISSDGFMVNVTVILDMLCEPFMDAQFSKVMRIEADYFRRSPRVDISDETKMNADQSQSEAFYGKKASGESNFISEIFFLTAAAHRYGTEAANSKLDGMRKDLKRWDAQLAQMETERNKYASTPQLLQRFDEQMRKMKEKNEQAHSISMAIEGVLLDDVAQARSMSFMRYVIVWLLRMVSGVEVPRVHPTLPLPSPQSETFINLPEYFLEDIVDHFKFITSHMPHVISPTQCDELVMVCITFLRSSDYIRNPYLKSGLVSILFYGVSPFYTRTKGVLGDVLNTHDFALKHLLHAIMQFYIECESTGAHTQFYDKFNIRYEIFQVIKSIWGNIVYRENLEREAKTNNDFFVHFTNLLLNDVTYVLDESFTSFQKIKSLSDELRTIPAPAQSNDPNNPTPEETQYQEKQEALEEAKRKAKSYMGLTTSTVDTLKLFTDALADAFTSREVVQRLADMLDYNLDALVGPKTREIAVENKEEYGFKPILLLSDIMDVYLNLASKTNFQVAIARDGRSYKPQNFDAAHRIISRTSTAMKGPNELKRWQFLKDKVAEAKAADDAEEEDLGEGPDEFYDPLLATIMEDPVTLPLSKAVMDRGTIRQHLLSDAHDPFNRSPLKIEDVITNDELRERIQAWKQERKDLKRKEREGAMDTSAD